MLYNKFAGDILFHWETCFLLRHRRTAIILACSGVPGILFLGV